MTDIGFHCVTCCAYYYFPPESLLLTVCTDDAKWTSVVYECPVCGPQIRPVRAHEPEVFEAVGVKVKPWSLSETMREFGDRLDSTLEAILSEAS